MSAVSTFVLAGLIRIAVPAEPSCANLAAADLAADLGRVLGVPGQVVARGPAEISLALDPTLPGGAEAWRIDVAPSGVRIAGRDGLGLTYGIYQFAERCLKVDPLWFWKGMPPERRERIALEPQTLKSVSAKFRYRGWFINDEDLLTEFGTSAGPRHIDYPFYQQVIDVRMAERIYEALLRLGGNLIIPASFVDVMNPPEAELVRRAVARGLYVTQHHVEPMGVSHFSFEKFWRERGAAKSFSYSTEPEAVRTVWRAYAAKWHELAGDRVIWQLGMRGRGDRPIWIDDKSITRATGGAFISRAIADQWEIVRAVDTRAQPLATTTLFLEGADLMAAGELKLPHGITVVFSDKGESQELQEDFRTCPRLPEYRYGVYYHVAFWRRGPHLLPGIVPERIPALFAQLEARGDTAYAIVNVSNIREHVLGAHVFIRTALRGAAAGLAPTLAEFAPAAVQPLIRAYHAGLVRRADGPWLQDGTCVDAAEVYLRDARAKRPAALAAVRRLIDADATERAAARLEQVATDAELAAIPPRWRTWARGLYVVQGRHLAALYRATAALARDDPAGAARQIEHALEIRRELAVDEWTGWYAGDKKANWPSVAQRLRAIAPPSP